MSYSISWVKQQSLFNTTGNETAPRIVTDSANNIYMTYATTGTVSSGTNNGVSTDVVVAKFTSTGTLLWTRQQTVMNSSSTDTVPTIAVDVLSNVYVTYQSAGTVSGGTLLGSTDIVVFKMDTNGAIQWIKETAVSGTTLADTVPTIAVDSTGSSYVAYQTAGTVSGGTYMGGGSGGDIVVFKLDTNGAIQWIKEQTVFNTANSEFTPVISVDGSNNVYISYITIGTVSGGTSVLSGTASCAVVMKMSSAGAITWIKQLAAMNTLAASSETVPSIATDTAGNSYVAYVAGATVSGGTFLGSGDIVVFKMDTSGNVGWVKELALMNTTGTEATPLVALDSSSNVYITYSTTGTVSGGTLLGSSDIVVVKMDTNGDIQWMSESAAFNTVGADTVPSIAVDRYGNVNIAYQTAGTVSGGTLLGGSDIVMAQISQPVVNPANYVAWVKELTAMNTSAAEGGMRLKSDALGNSYIVYTTAGTVSGGTLRGSTDIVLVKVSSGGVLQWVRQVASINTSAAEATPSIAVDRDGNSYITYTTAGTVSGGTYLLNNDIVVARFNTNGNLVWIKANTTFSTTTTEAAPSIALDPTGTNVYISYHTFGTTSGGIQVGNGDIVVSKIATATGLITWIRQLAILNTTGTEGNASIAVDSAGNSYVIYQTGGTVSGGTYLGNTDVVISKLDTNGIVAWVKQPFQINTSLTESSPFSIAVDAGNNVYVAYTSTGTVSGGTFMGGATPGDVVVSKLNSNGVLQWVREQNIFNTTSNEWEANVTVDPFGNAYVVYAAGGTVSGGTNLGPSDITILKLTNTGTIATLLQLPVMNTVWNEGTPSISTDSSGGIYIAYYSSGTVSSGTYLGGNDVVVAKLVQYAQTPTVPTAPTSVTAVSGDSTSAIVSWTPATNLYNAVVSSYTVTSSPGSFSALVDGSLTTATITGLTYNTSYTFAVTATNSVGTSSAATSSSITIRSAPSAPQNVSYIYAPNQITVSWSAPASAGDSDLTSYTVRCSPFESVQTTADASTTFATFTGLTNGTPYNFTVVANNQYATGPAATLTNAICSTVPTAPTLTPRQGDTYGGINVLCSGSAANGRAITSYTVIANPGGATAVAGVATGQTTFVAVFSNLTQGQSYTFTGYATNPDGNSLISAVSAAITPSSDLYYMDWVKQFPAMNTTVVDHYPSVSLDAAGNIYIMYQTNGTVSGGTNIPAQYLAALAKVDKRGQLQWVRQQANLNTSATSYNAMNVATDSSGNSYITYSTNGVVSGGVFLGGNADIVTAKLDTYGNILWIQQPSIMNTAFTDAAPYIAIDASGNSYVTYLTYGTVSGGTFVGINGSAYNVVVSKFNTNGRIQWIKEYAVMNAALVTNSQPYIAVDNSGNVYVTHVSFGTISGGTYRGNGEIVVTKLDTNGNILWIKEEGVTNTSSFDEWPTLVVNSAGDIYVGYMTQSVVSGGTSLGSRDIAMFKMNSSGVVQWVKQYALMNTSNNEYYPKLGIDASGNVYVYYMSYSVVSGGINVGATSYASPVLAKVDSNGTLLFVKQQPLMGGFLYTTSVPIGFAVDPSGNVAMAYSTFGPISGGSNLGSVDMVVSRMVQHTVSSVAAPVVSVSSQDLQAVVSWTSDTTLYVNPITSYTIVTNPGNLTTTVSDPLQTSATITGLTGGGTEYTFTVTANTVAGSVSADPVSATIYGQPGAPTNLTTIVGNQQITVSWVAPTVAGELPITSYTVVSNPGGFTATTVNASITRAIVSGLTNGIPYTFTVYANTSGGRGVSSTPSAVVYASSIPLAPYGVVATQSVAYGTVNVNWQMESNGGSAITSYTVTSTPGNVRQTVTSAYALFTGLDPNTSYTFSVYATNANGSSPSATSNAINPSADLVYLEWIKEQAIMNTTNFEYRPSIGKDVVGNVYVTYYTGGTVSGGTFMGGSYDIVVFKMDTNGNVQWIKEQSIMNTTGTDYNPIIAVDPSGNSYVTYYTFGTVSGGTYLGGGDIVVFKMDTNGNLQWIKEQSNMNTTGGDQYPTIAVDSAGNSYITYYTTGIVSSGTVSGNNDIVVFKMDANGTLQWIQQQAVMNTTLSEFNPVIAVDASGNLYVSYHTSGTVSGGQLLVSYDIVVFKMDNNGVVQWIKEQPAMNTSDWDYYPSIGVDSSANVYVTYYTWSTVSGGTNSGGVYDVVVFKMDTNGVLQWIKQQAVMNTTGGDQYPTIAVDASGNSYVSYYTSGTVSGGTLLGNPDIVVFKMDTNGVLQWIKEQPIMNTTSTDYYPTIAVDSSKNIYVAYYTSGRVSGGTYLGNQDIVVFKMGQHVVSAPPTPTVTAVAGNLKATVTWTMPPDPLVNPITSYVVTSNLGHSATVNGLTNTVVFTGLTGQGTSYTFTVVSTNALGTSTATSNTIQVYALATAPTVSATSTNGQATINWLPPSSSGDGAITNYTITWMPGNGTFTTADNTAINFTNYVLTNGITYKFTVVANGPYGSGDSASVFTTPSTIPSSVVVTPMYGNRYSEIILRFSCDTGGASILSYTVTMNPGNLTYVFGGTSAALISNLDPAVGYTFSATATNYRGTSLSSSTTSPFYPSSDLMYMDWIKQTPAMNTSTSDVNPKMALDASGNTYITYYTLGTVSGGTNRGGNDVVVSKLDTNGNLLWIKQPSSMNTTTTDSNPTIAVDASGNSYIVYQCSATVSGGTNRGGTDVVVAKLDTDGNVQWTKQQLVMNTAGNDLNPYITLDASGNMYVIYQASGTVSGGTFLGNQDIVVFKMDNNGNMMWIKQHFSLNSTNLEANPSIATDDSGNVYVTYYTNATVSGGVNKGSVDIVVAKLDTNGNLVWIKQQLNMNTTSNDYSSYIAVDPSGNSYITYFAAGAVSSGSYMGNNDIVIFKMDTNGNVLWIKEPVGVNTSSVDQNPMIAIDNSGNSYIVYYTTGTVSGGTNIGSQDIAFCKLDIDGTVQWIKQSPSMNTRYSESIPSIAVDKTSGAVYISYLTYGSVSGGQNAGDRDIVLTKFSTHTTGGPSAPTNLAASGGDARANISWNTPFNGNSVITSYTITLQPGNITYTTENGLITSATVTGLTNNITYTCTITATNSISTSSPSASITVTPTNGNTVPDPPTSIIASADYATATVTWTPPLNTGGLPLIGYVVICSPAEDGFVTQSVDSVTTTATFDNLLNGITYTFTVKSVNSLGLSVASNAATAAYTDPVITGTLQGALTDPTAVQSYLVSAITTTKTIQDNYIELRNSLKASNYTITDDALVRSAMVPGFLSANTNNPILTLGPQYVPFFFNSVTSSTQVIPHRGIQVLLPTYTSNVATYDLATTPLVLDGTQYVHVEIPAGSSITFTDSQASKTLTYDGINLTDGTTSYVPGNTLTIGSRTYIVSAIGSITLLPVSPNKMVIMANNNGILKTQGGMAILAVSTQ